MVRTTLLFLKVLNKRNYAKFKELLIAKYALETLELRLIQCQDHIGINNIIALSYII